ncbi:MAG: electron transport complex subunit RsxG [Cellvibrionaceae bacterium]
MLGSSISFNSVLLGAFALVTAGIVAITFQSTYEKIDESKLRAAQAALYEIIPEEKIDNDLFNDTIDIPEDYREFLGLTASADTDKKIHIAKKNDIPFAAIIPTTAPEGYSGPIKMIIGINKDGTIAGVRVTDHNETPGLGDYVDIRKSNWVLSFNGKSLGSRFDTKTTVKRPDSSEKLPEENFDQLTGATITRTAVIRQIKKTLSFYQIAQPLDIYMTETPGTNIEETNTHIN